LVSRATLALPIIVTSIDDDIVHALLLVTSVILMTVGANAYRKARDGRYFLLMLAFVFFFLDQTVTAYQEFYLSGELIAIPFLGLHVVHVFEFLMSASFLGALLKPSGLKRTAAR
jgi:hypothetical protein